MYIPFSMARKKLYSFKCEPELINLVKLELKGKKISTSEFLRQSIKNQLKNSKKGKLKLR